MIRRLRFMLLGLSACAPWLAAGCGDSGVSGPAGTPGAGAGADAQAQAQVYAVDPKSEEEKQAILKSVIQLVQTASSNPGGTNFDQATELLNQYFAGVPQDQFTLPEASRAYLLNRFGAANQAAAIRDFEDTTYTIRDARHIEDSLLAYNLALRVGGDGDDLTRARRVFDWIVRQVQLVPRGALSPPNMEQVPARPFDVLLRGMATEERGDWAERTWLFMALCRQLNLDAGILLLPPRRRTMLETAADQGQPVPWICAVLVDGQPYLFDARLGMAIPGPGGHGVATFDQAATDRSILDALDLPGVASYGTRAADLNAGKVRIWVDSTLGRLSPRMRELQKNLGGRHRMILFRDPSEQAVAFSKALTGRFGGTSLWPLPMQVEYGLFNSPQFVEATQYPIRIFDSKLPLLPARMAQLRGELDDSVQRYVGFRYGKDLLQSDDKTPIPPEVQHVLDLYATYFLALAKLDQKQYGPAESLFRDTLRLLPPPAPDQPFYSMFRWGAETNLGLLYEAQGNAPLAIRYYTESQPTAQYIGNLLRARDLIWKDPFVPTVPAAAGSQPATPAEPSLPTTAGR